MKTGAVIVAAGKNSDWEQFLPLKKIGSISAIERIIYTFRQAGVEQIVIVTGNQAELIEKHLSGTGVVFIRNEKYAETEMLDSAKIGLEYVQKCDRVFFTPADVPLFSVQTLKALLECGANVCIPMYNGREGHPLLISSDLIDGILNYSGNLGMRGAVFSTSMLVSAVSVDDRGILLDIDSETASQKHIDMHNRQLLRPIMNLSLAREQNFMNSLTANLLEIIAETNSVKLACERLKISYSLGWKMLKTIEKNLGKPIVSKSRGGIGGGYSELTEDGKELLRRYRMFQKECFKFAEENFEKWFEPYKKNRDI
ncbi:MAG: molybdenum cofactor cytidylyltransferase [Clostridiales bacterium]|jgi:molybdate transport repressor ModE-like protein|nr:molybdenum cofactor cytidylyltransferase [Clostridiales bacterium]